MHCNPFLILKTGNAFTRFHLGGGGGMEICVYTVDVSRDAN